jgi:hypothetical protein
MNNNTLLEQIKGSLKIADRENHNSQREWTTAFKNTLYNLGKEHGYIVYPNKDKFEGQWLVDLCWAIEGENWQKDFKGLKLACEIEWSRNMDNILYDFQKLTVIDAEIRLMIFQYRNEIDLDEYIKAILQASNYTKSKGYNYLIAASCNESDLKIIDL